MRIGRYHYTIILNRLLDRDSTSCQSINTLFGGSGHGSHGEQHRQKKYKGSQSFHKMSSCSLLSKLQEPILCFSVPSFIFLPVHRTPPLSASSYHNFRFLQANSPPSVLFRKECRLSPFYFSEIALVAVFPLHLTGICGMIQDVFLFLFAAAMPEGSPARRQGNGSNTHTFLLETERTRYIWDSLRKFSERTVSGS